MFTFLIGLHIMLFLSGVDFNGDIYLYLDIPKTFTTLKEK